MIIQSNEFIQIPTSTGNMGVHRFCPTASGAFPSVILYSEIYQVTGPIRRLASRLAGEGFEVLVPEVYHEYEKPGTVLAYDAEGTQRGNDLKYEKPLAGHDSDRQALIDWIYEKPRHRGVGTLGFCLGGHLAFRAALDSRVRVAGCFYPTDIHSATLGAGKSDDTLARVKEMEAEFVLIWGRQDPHVPGPGRSLIYTALTQAERLFQWHEFNAAHAFSRDEGPRYDAAVSRLSWDIVLEALKRIL